MEQEETLVEFVCTRCGMQGLALAEAAAGRVGALRPVRPSAAQVRSQTSATATREGPLQVAHASTPEGADAVRLGVPRCPDCGTRLQAYKVRLRPIRLRAVG